MEISPFSFPASPQGKLKTRAEKGKCKRTRRFHQYSRPPRPAYFFRPVSGLAHEDFRLPIPKDSGWVKNREALTVAGAAQV